MLRPVAVIAPSSRTSLISAITAGTPPATWNSSMRY